MNPGNEKRDQATPSETRQRPDMIGRILSDRYRIDAVIASGSFGSVYRGAHLHMHKQVAIKVLHPEVENFPELVERFEREAVAGAHISHPNVAVASDLGKFDGDSYFLVQEYVPGVTLREVMKAGPMPAERAAHIARQIAQALGAAHLHKIVHRDLKPSNIMIVDGTNDHVKLIDFGFARVPIEELPHVPQGDQGPHWEMSQAGVVFGSVSYMAPDVFLGMQNVDERSDLYALGLIFYEMLAGQHPFDVNLPTGELFALQRHGTPPPLREKHPDCDASKDLEWVIMRLLAKDPEARYQDATSVVAAIDGAMQGLHGYAERRDSHRAPAVLPARRVGLPSLHSLGSVGSVHGRERPKRAERRWLSWLLGGGVALLALFAGLTMGRIRSGSDAEQDPASPASVAAANEAPISAHATKVAPDPLREFLGAADGAPAQAAGAWLRLVAADDKALDKPEIQSKTVALLSRAEAIEDPVKRVFDKLAYAADELGLDLLYRVVEDHAESPAAQHALPVLYKQLSRASPALRVTLDFRRLSCRHKFRQLDRAAREGDERTLRELEKLQTPGCVIKRGACCVKSEPRLDASLARLRDRTGTTGN